MDIPTNLLADFCRVTNADETVASQLLRDSGLDLEAAITSFFAIQEAGGLPPEVEHPPPSAPTAHHDHDHDHGDDAMVDDDIDQIARHLNGTDTALPNPNLPHSAPSPSHPAPPPSSSSTAAAAATAPLEQLQSALAADAPIDSHVMRSFRDTLRGQPYQQPDGPVAARRYSADTDPFLRASAQSDRLGDMFKPPEHLVCSERFESALDVATAQRKWLLVAVFRAGEFASYEMNRDVWNDGAMQQLVASHFVFWLRESSNATDYAAFYDVPSCPHVAVIDPRNRERVRLWDNGGNPLPKVMLLDGLQDFISGNSFESDRVIRGKINNSAASSAAAAATAPASTSAAAAGSGSGSGSASAHLPRPIDRTAEDAQLAAAIAASMEQEGADGSPATATAAAAAANADSIPRSAAEASSMVARPGANGEDSQRVTSRLLSATDPALNRTRSLLAEQDDAFQESLLMDRAKAASERAEREREERVAREAQERVDERERKKEGLPAEPERSFKEDKSIVEIAVRMPNGQRVSRKFWIHNSIGDVCDFVEVSDEEGALDDVQYELMSAYPKKQFTDRSATLEELAPRGALVVHITSDE